MVRFKHLETGLEFGFPQTNGAPSGSRVGFRVGFLGFGVLGLGFRVWVVGFGVLGLGFRVWVFRVWGFGFRI